MIVMVGYPTITIKITWLGWSDCQHLKEEELELSLIHFSLSLLASASQNNYCCSQSWPKLKIMEFMWHQPIKPVCPLKVPRSYSTMMSPLKPKNPNVHAIWEEAAGRRPNLRLLSGPRWIPGAPSLVSSLVRPVQCSTVEAPWCALLLQTNQCARCLPEACLPVL